MRDLITTPQVIKMYEAQGIPCDQATVSCLARQGRFMGKKLAGAWIFTHDSVWHEIRACLKQRARIKKETDNANQQT